MSSRIKTATAGGKLFLVKRPTKEYLVQFMEVSDRYAHSAVIRFYENLASGTHAFANVTIPLKALTNVDQEAAKAIWLLQTGEEL
jgi:hypothetical protein